MFNWFRSGTPYTLLLLLLYALVVKCYYLIFPTGAIIHADSDGFLYQWLVPRLSEIWGAQSIGFSFLAWGVLFLQALGINNIANHYRLFPKTTYFPAMCYLLFSSFFPEWNHFSAPLLANLGMVWIFAKMVELYSSPTPRGFVFNIGCVIGIITMIYPASLLFLLLLWAALLVNRPFRITEWIIAMLGVLCPFYLLATFLFLLGDLEMMTHWPIPAFSLPGMTHDYRRWTILAIMIIPLLYGCIRLQQFFFKQLIQVRKIWLLLIIYLIIAISLPFISPGFHYEGWVLALIPLTAFQANACWHIRRNILGNILHGFLLTGLWLMEWWL